MNPDNPAAVWQAMTGEPVLELWRIEQDRWYAKLEYEAEQSKPTQTPLEMIKKTANAG